MLLCDVVGVVVVVLEGVETEVGGVAGCTNGCSCWPIVLVEPDCPCHEYHPLFSKNEYQPFSSEAPALKGINSNMNNITIFRGIIVVKLYSFSNFCAIN